MTEPTEADAYVRKLLWALQSLPHEDRLNIAAEIHSHLSESATAGRDAAARAYEKLGPPHLLARRFVEEYELAGALHRAAPGRLLLAILSRGSRNVAALGAGFGAVLCYVFALTFLVVAAAKPVMPANVGLWRTGDGATLAGLVAVPPTGADLLGLWIIPVALAAAIGCYLFGTQVLRHRARHLLGR
ncbi:HAAS signaling domain-containing protein [Sphingomonas endolithica]|uniref:HAAS signaling domain-containing protein n=1 Tax=Sphingomonas endolithica TaxID=2972485 RepID=UPI0021AECFB7|nr:hypothetical protein [Sphingomonas sp. ZFBP2030]